MGFRFRPSGMVLRKARLSSLCPDSKFSLLLWIQTHLLIVTQCVIERVVHQENIEILWMLIDNIWRWQSGAIQYRECVITVRNQTYSLGTYNWVVSINQENWLNKHLRRCFGIEFRIHTKSAAFHFWSFSASLTLPRVGEEVGLWNRKVSISLVEGPQYLASSSLFLDYPTNEQQYLAGALDLELTALSHQVSVSSYIYIYTWIWVCNIYVCCKIYNIHNSWNCDLINCEHR